MYDVVNVTQLNWSMGYYADVQRHVRRGKCDKVKLVNGILAFPFLNDNWQRHVRRAKCDTVKLVTGILAFLLMITGRDMYDVVNVTRLNWSLGY